MIVSKTHLRPQYFSTTVMQYSLCPVYLLWALTERLVLSTINIIGWRVVGWTWPPQQPPYTQGWTPRTRRCDWPPPGQEIEEERRERKGVISLAKLPAGLMRETNQPAREANITAHLLDWNMSPSLSFCHNLHEPKTKRHEITVWKGFFFFFFFHPRGLE